MAIITSYNKSVPIKSNILIIQTDTPSVILGKHPRFSIYQESNIGLYNHCTQGSGPVSNKVMKICYDNLTEIFFGMANSLGEERRARLRLYKVKECLITLICFCYKEMEAKRIDIWMMSIFLPPGR